MREELRGRSDNARGSEHATDRELMACRAAPGFQQTAPAFS